MSARVLDSGAAVRQQALSLVAALRRGEGERLAGLLRARRGDVLRALARVSTLHFCRFVVLPPAEQGSGSEAPYRLAFESNFDGELGPHLAELRVALGSLLDEIFGACEGFPKSGDASAFHAFAVRHSLRASAFYGAHPGLSVKMIKNDAALRRAVDRYLDERGRGGALRGTSPRALAVELRDHVTRVAAPAEDLFVGRVRRWLPASSGGIWELFAARPLSFVLAFALAPLFEVGDRLGLWRSGREDRARLQQLRDEIGADEDRLDQNGLTHLVPIKPGAYRLFVLELMLRVADALAALGAPTSRLGSLESIHFARWIVLPDRRLLFFSNYDGSWDAYLGDFIDKASKGLSMIWTNTVGFPKTWLLLWRGARDEQAFKRWTRSHQLPDQIWYSAYPELSVRDVVDNARLRELLAGDIDGARAEALMRLL